jgi:hypothetical protein
LPLQPLRFSKIKKIENQQWYLSIPFGLVFNFKVIGLGLAILGVDV